MTCLHPSLDANCAVARVVKREDDIVPFKFILEVSVRCLDCGCQFYFDWAEVADPCIVPGLGEVRRPYITARRDVLCVPILPEERLNEIDKARNQSAFDQSPSLSKH